MTVVLILPIHPVSCDLVPLFFQHHRNRTVLDPGIDRAPEQRFYLLWPCGCRDIPVARLPPQHSITHAASYRIRLIALFF